MDIKQLHKIPGVEKNVCTAEQVVAYNFAQTYQRVWSAEEIAGYAARYMAENPSEFARFNQTAVVWLIEHRAGTTYTGGIAASYRTVGVWFPLSKHKGGRGGIPGPSPNF